MKNRIVYTKWTSTDNPVTKSYTWSAMQKQKTGCGLIKHQSRHSLMGRFELVTVSSIGLFAEQIAGRGKMEYHTYGVTQNNRGAYGTKSNGFGDITRGLNHVKWPDNDYSFLTIDLDKTMSTSEFIEILRQIIPNFEKLAYLIKPSCGALVKKGNLLVKGLTGQRCYLICEAKHIPNTLNQLNYRAWALGLGWVIENEAGRPMPRSPIDLAMQSPIQPDYVCRAITNPPLRLACNNSYTILSEGLPITPLPPMSTIQRARLKRIQRKAMQDLGYTQAKIDGRTSPQLEPDDKIYINKNKYHTVQYFIDKFGPSDVGLTISCCGVENPAYKGFKQVAAVIVNEDSIALYDAHLNKHYFLTKHPDSR